MKPLQLAIALLLVPLVAASQKLSSDFVLTMTNALRPSTPSDLTTVDIITAGVCLKPDGTLADSLFSPAASATMRKEIMKRLRIMRVGNVPIDEYWKQFCTRHNIRHDTYFIQPSLLRMDHSDGAKFSVEQITGKLQDGLLFARPATIIKDAAVIWFPVRVQRWSDKESIKE